MYYISRSSEKEEVVETGGQSDAPSSMTVKTGMTGGTEVLVNIKYSKSLLPRRKEQFFMPIVNRI